MYGHVMLFIRKCGNLKLVVIVRSVCDGFEKLN